MVYMDNWLTLWKWFPCECLTLWGLVFGSQSVGHCIQRACHRVWVWGLETRHNVQTAHLQHQHRRPQPGNSHLLQQLYVTSVQMDSSGKKNAFRKNESIAGHLQEKSTTIKKHTDYSFFTWTDHLNIHEWEKFGF